jgi:LL-diaminopimelate aminotransferase
MTGWRVGFAVGNPDLIKGLGKIKENVDSGLFQAIQAAAVAALESDQSTVEASRRMYQERRDIFCKGLDSLGWKYFVNKATFYVWVRTPQGISSIDMTMKLMNEAGIVSTPGSGFGEFGEGYIRFSLTVDKETIKKVIEKLRGVKL